MIVSKETIEKVKRLRSLLEEADRITAELHLQFQEHFDGCCIENFYVAAEPEGHYQQDGEYCDQWTGYIEDSGSGTYYYPSSNPKEYLAITYSF